MADLSREQFDALVRRIETGLGHDPVRLRRRVLAWAVAGYAGLLAPFLVVVLVAAGFYSAVYWADHDGRVLGAVGGTLVLGVLGTLALRALALPSPPPHGVPVARQEAPALFGALDELRTRLNAVAFDRVWLTPETNAGVVQQPRLGVLGWSRNHLLIGLPLLESMSRDELVAVLAHEFAHLSRNHGRSSHWIYRLRRSWERTFAEMSQRPRRELSLRSATLRFVHWFWPAFNAHAFVLSRAQEYEADATGARLVSTTAMATALLRLQLVSRQLGDHFWEELWDGTKLSAEPPRDVMERVRQALVAGPSSDVLFAWQRDALRSVTTNADTHPCVNDRIVALNVLATDQQVTTCAASVSAAETLLGPAAVTLRQQVSALWCDDVRAAWKQRHGRTSVLTQRLDLLHNTTTDVAASERLWDEALVALDVKGRGAATPLLRRVLEVRPDHPFANLQLGRILLDEGKVEGEALIERALAANSDLLPQAGPLLHDHYRRLGATDKLRALAQRLDQHELEAEAARKERAQVEASDVFVPHGLDSTTLAAVCQVLSAEPEAERAELAQKQLLYFPERRLFVLCVHRKSRWPWLGNTEEERSLARRVALKVQLPGRVLVFPPSGSYRGLAKALQSVPAARIWTREA
jgi:Zn-dependent protease with chaperone function